MVLDIPSDEILAFTDDIIWNRILGIECGLPRKLENKWKTEAIESYPNNIDLQKNFIRSQRDEFWNQKPLSGNWWGCLFVEEKSDENVIALIAHPIKPEWVISNPLNN